MCVADNHDSVSPGVWWVIVCVWWFDSSESTRFNSHSRIIYLFIKITQSTICQRVYTWFCIGELSTLIHEWFDGTTGEVAGPPVSSLSSSRRVAHRPAYCLVLLILRHFDVCVGVCVIVYGWVCVCV